MDVKKLQRPNNGECLLDLKRNDLIQARYHAYFLDVHRL